jgi:hypothetical protein
VSCAFYHYLRGTFRHGAFRISAWIHLIPMNVGASAAAGMMMYASYQGCAAMLPEDTGEEDLMQGRPTL